MYLYYSEKCIFEQTKFFDINMISSNRTSNSIIHPSIPSNTEMERFITNQNTFVAQQALSWMGM